MIMTNEMRTAFTTLNAVLSQAQRSAVVILSVSVPQDGALRLALALIAKEDGR